jgi:hypothetical protein
VAGLVLTLACVGIFGVVAYAVKLTKEIGMRRALGAQAAHVISEGAGNGRTRLLLPVISEQPRLFQRTAFR